jgi:threonine/homoserine/homoserine lactone efflux protein
MQVDLLWAFVIIFAIDSITPGPAVAMVMSRGASVGLIRTLPFIAGLVIGDLLLFCMALLGLAALANSFVTLFFIIKWIGVCYLLYLAHAAWTAKPATAGVAPTGGTGVRSFLLALFLPLGNPKAVGFYVALLPAFMNVEELTVASALNFSLAIVLIWSLVLVFYTALADQGRRFLRETDALKWLNRGAAGAMVGAAGAVALRD